MARVTVCPLSGNTKVTRQGKSYICLMCLCVNRVSIQSSDFAFFFILLRLGRRQGEWKLTRRLEHHHLCRVLSRPCLFCSPVLQYPQSALDLSTSQSSLLFLHEHIAAQQLNDDVFTSKGSTISTAMHFKYTMCVKSRGSDFSSTSCLSYNDALISSLKLFHLQAVVEHGAILTQWACCIELLCCNCKIVDPSTFPLGCPR